MISKKIVKLDFFFGNFNENEFFRYSSKIRLLAFKLNHLVKIAISKFLTNQNIEPKEKNFCERTFKRAI